MSAASGLSNVRPHWGQFESLNRPSGSGPPLRLDKGRPQGRWGPAAPRASPLPARPSRALTGPGSGVCVAGRGDSASAAGAEAPPGDADIAPRGSVARGRQRRGEGGPGAGGRGAARAAPALATCGMPRSCEVRGFASPGEESASSPNSLCGEGRLNSWGAFSLRWLLGSAKPPPAD